VKLLHGAAVGLRRELIPDLKAARFFGG